VGPHKAMLFAGDASGRDVYLVSDLPEESVRRMLLTPASSVEEAVKSIISKNPKFQDAADGNGTPPDVAIIPAGNATIPVR